MKTMYGVQAKCSQDFSAMFDATELVSSHPSSTLTKQERSWLLTLLGPLSFSDGALKARPPFKSLQSLCSHLPSPFHLPLPPLVSVSTKLCGKADSPQLPRAP